MFRLRCSIVSNLYNASKELPLDSDITPYITLITRGRITPAENNNTRGG